MSMDVFWICRQCKLLLLLLSIDVDICRKKDRQNLKQKGTAYLGVQKRKRMIVVDTTTSLTFVPIRTRIGRYWGLHTACQAGKHESPNSSFTSLRQPGKHRTANQLSYSFKLVKTWNITSDSLFEFSSIMRGSSWGQRSKLGANTRAKFFIDIFVLARFLGSASFLRNLIKYFKT